jgi:predicted nucleic acid-binding protein
MLVDSAYIDTSALAKRYLNEPGSNDFDQFLREQRRRVISRLGVLELRCLLARRRRAGEISADYERDALGDFADDSQRAVLLVEPVVDGQFHRGRDLIDRLPTHPLRALDALHLAIAGTTGSQVVATADQVMAPAASDLGFDVVLFG